MGSLLELLRDQILTCHLMTSLEPSERGRLAREEHAVEHVVVAAARAEAQPLAERGGERREDAEELDVDEEEN